MLISSVQHYRRGTFLRNSVRRSWNRAVQLWFHRISQHRPILIIFELLLLRETLLFCMIATVAVHAVANSCCLCNSSSFTDHLCLVCVHGVFYTFHVSTHCSASVVSALQILERSTAITLQSIHGIIQGSS